MPTSETRKTQTDSLSRKIAEILAHEWKNAHDPKWIAPIIAKELAEREQRVEVAIQAANEMMYALGNIYSHGVNHPLSFKSYEDAIKSCDGWRAALSGLGVSE